MDLRKPYLWYPVARSLKRKFIYHAGPTNSGKTYTALQVFLECKSSISFNFHLLHKACKTRWR